MTTRYPCPCCGFLTLEQEAPGSFDICAVCFWEDDNIQYYDADYAGGANRVSLNQARKNFLAFRASSKRVLKFVRKPRQEERPT